MSFSFHICIDFYDTVMGFCLIPITIIMQMKAIRLIPLIYLLPAYFGSNDATVLFFF